MNKELFNILNQTYESISKKSLHVKEMISQDSPTELGFFNGHYRMINQEYFYENFPIPVLTIIGLCDIEFEIDGLSLTSKFDRKNIQKIDFSKIGRFHFEIYDIENYLSTYFDSSKDEILSLRVIIEKQKVDQFFISFELPETMSANEIVSFIRYLKEHYFFY